jgi:putative ABC transport system ATP-binding protein
MCIEFYNVTKSRTRPSGETLRVLDSVTFKIPGLRRIAIIGPSGSGKTTILRLINRLEDPDSGTITFNDVDTRTIDGPALRRRVGMVFQQPLLFDETVRENLNRPLELAGRPPLSADAEIEALERVGLDASLLSAPARELSIGQQQRVAIARALVLEPEVLLLDEPTSALDPRSAAMILHLLNDLQERMPITIVMVSHTMEQAEMFAERVLAIRDGEVREFDTVAPALAWAMPENVDG